MPPKEARVRMTIDRSRCIGAANCVAVAPTVFRLDEENKAIVLDVSSVSEDKLWEAAESCPTDAIILEDDGGRRLYPS
ncbi:MAG: ferredoxin [Chloroflexi bacterium]|nr:ferredoxin [Chloroflexota bacterium]